MYVIPHVKLAHLQDAKNSNNQDHRVSFFGTLLLLDTSLLILMT